MEVNVGGGIRQPVPKPERRQLEGGFISAYMRYTSEHEGSRKFHLWTAISVLAAVMGRKIYLERAYYSTFPNLYILIVGPAGIVKKSTTTAIGVNLLRAIPGFRIMSDQVTQASMIDALAESGVQYEVPGSPDKRVHSPLYIYASELKALLDEVHGALPELLTHFFDCSPPDDKTPWRRTTKGGGDVSVYAPCINLLGCSTSAWLRLTIPVKDLEGGFASRILFVIDNSLPEKLVAIPRLHPELRAIKPKLINDLTYIHNLVGEAHMTQEAEDYFTTLYNNNMMDMAAKKGGDKFSGYRGRLGTMVEKVSMILSINESDSMIVELKHVKQAELMLNDLRSGMFEAFNAAGANPNTNGIVMIFNFIKARGSVAASEIIRTVWMEVTKPQVEECLAVLQSMGAIRQSAVGLDPVYIALIDSLDS